ncbi:MAG: SAM-dependent methyltransferase [Bacteroidales bacterium]|nr:SAM-dependent methyltransferase [Bacteroidales bacterium]
MVNIPYFQFNDPLGHAVWDYFQDPATFAKAVINVHSPLFDDDEIPVSYLFREYAHMPDVEKNALNLCEGSILDVGAGAGCHSLYLQQSGKNITALEKSLLAAKTMGQRGVNNVLHQDFWGLKNKGYNTILLLMNGLGLAGSIKKLPLFLDKCKSLLLLNGQIIADSSDIMYLYEGIKLPAKKYYGEVEYKMSYDKHVSSSFHWLFVDFDTLSACAKTVGMKATKLLTGEHHNYLVKLSIS